jgi:putative ABC transport system ATP-binding protein
LDLLKSLQRENASTLVVVTHDPAVAAYGDAQLRLRDGELVGVG